MSATLTGPQPRIPATGSGQRRVSDAARGAKSNSDRGDSDPWGKQPIASFVGGRAPPRPGTLRKLYGRGWKIWTIWKIWTGKRGVISKKVETPPLCFALLIRSWWFESTRLSQLASSAKSATCVGSPHRLRTLETPTWTKTLEFCRAKTITGLRVRSLSRRAEGREFDSAASTNHGTDSPWELAAEESHRSYRPDRLRIRLEIGNPIDPFVLTVPAPGTPPPDPE